MSITIHLTQNEPRKEKLCFVLHGFQLPQHNYQNDLVWYKIAKRFNGLPSTVRLKDFYPVEMTQRLQEWHFNLFRVSAGLTMSISELKKAWSSFWRHGRAFNDGLGTKQGYIDYINNPAGNLMSVLRRRRKGLGLNPIVTSGAILEIIHDDPIRLWGEDCWMIKTLNANNFDYSATWKSKPYQIFPAMNATRDGRIEHFPQLHGRPVPVPIIQRYSDFNFIPCDRVRVLSNIEPIPQSIFPLRSF